MKALLLSLAVPTVALVVPRAWTVTSSAPILDRSQRVKTGVSMLVPADVLTDALAGTPLESVTALPFYEPVATGIALSPAVAALAFVAKGGLQLALTPILKASGPTVPFDKYQLGRKIGSGNYGAVYEASSARDTEPSVVIKSTTTRDSRGQQFARAELFMNQKLKLCGQSGCMAQFEGHYTDDDGALNLVFRREGTLTLDKALQGDFPWNVEPTLLGSAADDRSLERRAKVIRTISGQVFANLAGIHSWSIVHRDVKGGNLILAERERRFKFSAPRCAARAPQPAPQAESSQRGRGPTLHEGTSMRGRAHARRRPNGPAACMHARVREGGTCDASLTRMCADGMLCCACVRAAGLPVLRPAAASLHADGS